MGAFKGLSGPLPSALRLATELRILTAAHHQMQGGIPSFTSTLSRLALQNNRLTVLPNLYVENNASTTAILLHNNLLSCHVPCGVGSTGGTSIVAIGNQLRYPKGEFPPWLSRYEHDPLFWVSGVEGMSLLRT